MKSFKTFIKQSISNKNENEISSNNHWGAVIHVEQGEHSQKETPKGNWPPAIHVSQGEHSLGDKKIKEDTTIKMSPHSFLRGMEGMNGEHPSDISSKLEQHYDHKSNPFFPAVYRYTQSSKGLNVHLFDHHKEHNNPHHPIDHPEFGTHVAELDKALGLQQLNRPLVVMSGLKKNPGLIMGGDKRLYHPAYLSTSIRPSVAGTFAVPLVPGTHDEAPYEQNHDMHILMAHLDSGQHGFYVGSRSKYRHEHEFLMPRRTMFRVHDHDVHHFFNSYGDPVKTNLHIWHATPINPDGKI